MTPASIARRFYLAFPDGVLDYACNECTALCCRGQGFAGSLRREMGRLLELYPDLETMATNRQREVVVFATPKGCCYFLDGRDDLCRIEKEHGRKLKPGVCVLFPFNVFGRIGNTVTISPHFLCPLRLQSPPRPGHVEGSHERILAAALDSGLIDEGFNSRTPASRIPASETETSAVAREEQFRDACLRGIGKRTFMETVRESERSRRVDDFVERGARVLGAGNPQKARKRDMVDDLLHALAPSLRIRMLHMPQPAIANALALGDLLVRRPLALSTGPPTLQAVESLFQSLGPALRLLARENEALDLPSIRRLKLTSFGEPRLTFAAFAVHREAERGRGVLEALERSFKPGLSAMERAVLVNDIGQRWESRSPRRRKNS